MPFYIVNFFLSFVCAIFRATGQVWLSHGWSFIYADEIAVKYNDLAVGGHNEKNDTTDGNINTAQYRKYYGLLRSTELRVGGGGAKVHGASPNFLTGGHPAPPPLPLPYRPHRVGAYSGVTGIFSAGGKKHWGASSRNVDMTPTVRCSVTPLTAGSFRKFIRLTFVVVSHKIVLVRLFCAPSPAAPRGDWPPINYAIGRPYLY